MPRVLANTIEGMDIAQAAHDIVASRWDDWDLTPYLAYLVDTCDASVLPYLADQFNVDGLRGFALAETEAEQRELIKQSIAIHKFIGTPWALREACRMIGFPVIILEEGVDTGDPDTDWARFRCYVDPADARKITGNMVSQFRHFVSMYKPERCHLVALGFWLPFEEKLFRDEDPDLENIYDGAHEYDGSITYGARTRENFDIQIIGQTFIDYFVIVDDYGDFPIDSDLNAIEYKP